MGGISGGALILTYGGELWFPVVTIMVLGGLGMAISIGQDRLDPNVSETQEEPRDENRRTLPVTLGGAAVALASFMALYWILSPIGFAPGSLTYTSFFSTFSLPFSGQAEQVASAVFLVFTVPWAEENFFRGMWGNLLIRYLPEGAGELASGVVFMTFHAAVYSLFLGPAWGLIALLTGAGAVFTGVDEYSQDIASSQISHSLYNLLSLGIQGSVLGAVIGPPPSSLLPQVAVIAPVAVGLIVVPNLLFRRAKTGGLRLR